MESRSIGSTYKDIANFSIAPAKFSVNLMVGSGDSYFSGAFKLVGWLSLPWTLLATIVTLPLGLIGYSAVAPFEACAKLENDMSKDTAHPSTNTSTKVISALRKRDELEQPNRTIMPHMMFEAALEKDMLTASAEQFRLLKADSIEILKDIFPLLQSKEIGDESNQTLTTDTTICVRHHR